MARAVRSLPERHAFSTSGLAYRLVEDLPSGKLAALALRSDGRLVAVAPMYIADGTLGLVGAGISDYLDVLSDPTIDGDGVTLLLRGALDFRWDCCFFDDLPPWSLLLRGQPAEESSVCPVATLPVTIFTKATEEPAPRSFDTQTTRRTSV